MPNSFQGGRQFPLPLNEEGKGYENQLAARERGITSALLNLLPSNYESTVVGPNYTLYLKAFAKELARITMVLERIAEGMSFERVPSDFLWETVGYLVFVNGKLPELGFDDESFREFLLTVIQIYFQGSTPEAIAQGIALFTDTTFTVRELYQDARQPGSIYDISDQFGFAIDFELQGQFPTNPFDLDANTRLLLELIRPAHTLYQIRFVFTEDIGELVDNITDTVSYDLRLYHYEETRKYCAGLKGFESTTGLIETPDLSLITDTDATKPITSPNQGARLTVFSGVNTGIYEVVGAVGDALQVYPPFKQAEEDVAYKVEIDRYGHKEEIFIVGETPKTSIQLDRFTVDAGGPYTVAEFNNLLLTATVSGEAGAVTYTWDLDGDNVFGDATGSAPTFAAKNGPDERTVVVKATDSLGRVSKAFALITIEDDGQVQGYGSGTGNANPTTSVFGVASASSSGAATVVAQKIKFASATASSTGSGTIGSTKSVSSTVTGTGAGSGTTTPALTAAGSAAPTGTGSGSATGVRVRPGMSSGAGTGSGATTPSTTASGGASGSGSGSGSASGTGP